MFMRTTLNNKVRFNSMNKTISDKTVTYDFERLMDAATLLKCSEFGDALIKNM